MPPRAKRPSAFEKKLSRIRELAAASAPGADELRALLVDREPYLAGQAAAAIATHRLRQLVPELAAALVACIEGAQPDAGCMASHPIAVALSGLDADLPETLRRGLTYVRMERVGPALVDRAIPVRIECAVALVRSQARGALLDLAPLLADPQPEVRAGVARAIGVLSGDGPAAMLHLALVSGNAHDEDPDVLGACMSGLLEIDPERYLGVVATHLADQRLAEMTAIALGESRLPAALPLLRAALDAGVDARTAAVLTLGIALLRSTEAIDTLLELAAGAGEQVACGAVRALAMHRHSSGLVDRVIAAVKARRSPKVSAAYHDAFASAATRER